jgi:D-sedoheptulose 7-phosphate isomerase
MKDQYSLAARTALLKDVLGRAAITSHSGESEVIESGIAAICNMMLKVRNAGRTLFLIGNGGSAGIASHAATDFFNVCKLRAMTLHETSMMTCMANDFGYENAFARMLGQMAQPQDMLIAISSSGKSTNILNAVEQARARGVSVVTLTGFAADNPLRGMGHLNVWLESSDYDIVEIGHQTILHNVSDRFGCGMVA